MRISSKYLNIINFSLLLGSHTSLAGSKDILIHSYTEQKPQYGSLNLTGENKASMEELVDDILRPVSKKIGISSNNSNIFSLIQSSVRTNQYKFEINGIPLCQFELKAHETINGSITVLGKMPDVEVYENYTLSQWPDVQDTMAIANAYAPELELKSDLALKSKKACLWVKSDELRKVWDMELKSAGLAYRVVADENEVFLSQPKHFHADGTARVYDKNPTDGTLIDYSVTGLIPASDGSVLVENNKFITLLDTSNYSYYKDEAAPYEFITGTEEEAFKEISLFTNANRALDWLESLGYQNFGTEPIRIVVHAQFPVSTGDGTTRIDINNALYQPGTEFSTIFVGDGDGSVLQNLALDYDVVAHELGHHVVYHSITNISGESLVLHEGIADFLTFSKTGDSCLGESICPAGSGICAINSQCLRTADNAYTLGAADLPNEPHLRSQFISGYLWDLVQKDGIDKDTVTRILLQAIDLWVSDSGYSHFILGLLVADEANFDGANCSSIYNRAVDRGLSEYISSYSCSAMPSLVASNENQLGGIFDETVSEESASESSSKSSSWSFLLQTTTLLI